MRVVSVSKQRPTEWGFALVLHYGLLWKECDEFFRSLVLCEEFLGQYGIWVVCSVLLRACALILGSNQNGGVLGVCFFTSRNELQSAFEKADNGPPPKAK